MDISGLRASDADREHVAEILREETAQGRLDVEESAHRLTAAYGATTKVQLEQLIADLPQPASIDTTDLTRSNAPTVALIAGLACPLAFVLILVVALIR